MVAIVPNLHKLMDFSRRISVAKQRLPSEDEIMFQQHTHCKSS